MRSILMTWLLLSGLLLQSVAWSLPDHRAAQTGRLAHALAHALDHGHHEHAPDDHGARGHEVDPALQWNESAEHGGHGPHHTHAADAGQVQGLPVTQPLAAPRLPGGPPGVWALVPPSSADPRGLLRPPRHTA